MSDSCMCAECVCKSPCETYTLATKMRAQLGEEPAEETRPFGESPAERMTYRDYVIARTFPYYCPHSRSAYIQDDDFRSAAHKAIRAADILIEEMNRDEEPAE